MNPPAWGTSGEADEKFLDTIRREMAYPHWNAGQRQVFELCLKWFYETHATHEEVSEEGT